MQGARTTLTSDPSDVGESVAEVIGAGHGAGQTLTHPDRDGRRRWFTLPDDIEVVIERRNLEGFRHGDGEGVGKGFQVPVGDVTIAVLDEMEVFDQEIAPRRRSTEKCGDLDRCLRVGLASPCGSARPPLSRSR